MSAFNRSAFRISVGILSALVACGGCPQIGSLLPQSSGSPGTYAGVEECVMSSSLTGYGIISFTVTQDRQVFMDHGDVKGLLLQAGVVQELRGFGYDGTAEVLEARFLQDTFYASVHIRLSLAHLGETIDQTDQTDQTDQHVLTWTNSNTVQYESTGWGSSLLLGTWSGTCDATLQRQP